MVKSIILFLVVLYNFSAIGQSLNNRRYVKTDSFKCEFFVSDKSIRSLFVRDSLMYYWCRAQKLFATQGGFSGALVDGQFAKFYHSGQLAEQGEYSMGLRDGEWKFWHSNGILKQKCRYQEGKIKGRLLIFDEQGVMIREEKYKNGKLKVQKEKQKGSKIFIKELKHEPKEKLTIKEKIRLFIDSKRTRDESGVVESKER